MQTFGELDDFVITRGEAAAAAGIGAGPALHDFRKHEAIDGGDVSEQVAEGEYAVAESPVDFVRRNGARHSHGALMNLLKVVQELCEVADFHSAAASTGLQMPRVISQIPAR